MASPEQLQQSWICGPAKENWMKKSQTLLVGLAQQNGFGSACFHTMMLMTANADKKAQQSLTHLLLIGYIVWLLHVGCN